METLVSRWGVGTYRICAYKIYQVDMEETILNKHEIIDDCDFSKESNLTRFVRKNRWLSLDFKGYRVLRCNWVTSLFASAIMWGFIGWTLNDEINATKQLGDWKSWVTINFTWLYICSRNIWLLFIFGLLFTKYKDVRLGKDGEKPHFSDFTWFSLLFSCGTGVGIFSFGVAEPIWFYRSNNNAVKIPFINDDQRAQMAMLISYYQNGLHGWVPYLVIGILLGIVCFRQGRPMAMRYAFQPLIGDSVNGLVGDIIDALTISTTTFGVCTSLGLGVAAIGTALNRLNPTIDANAQATQLAIIWLITAAASISVLIGLKSGIKNLARLAFFSGITLMAGLVCADNPGLIFNSYVQTLGHYIQWLFTLSWDCETWASFTGQLTDKGSWERLTWGMSKSTDVAAMTNFDSTRLDTSILQDEAWGSRSPYNFMNSWTVFYWAWWLAWAPFVGTFIARISRGRTVGEVVKGGLLAPITFMFINRNILGTLGIKMQRIVEYTIGKDAQIDWSTGSINCTALGYVNNKPVGEAALQLASEGYYALSCRSRPDQILDIMEPYGALTKWFQLLVLVSVILYFTTSSDSGSYVDDLIASQGYENPPPLQKLYWACTEGALAHALVVSGGLRVIQGVAIVATFPYTIAMCFLCVSLFRTLKLETGDEKITSSRKSFNTNVFDVFEGFDPESKHPNAPSRKERSLAVLRAIVFPFKSIKNTALECEYTPYMATIIGLSANFFQWMALSLFVASKFRDGANSMGWLMYLAFVSIVAKMRKDLRDKRNVYGNAFEDIFSGLTFYPFTIAQMEHEIKSGGKLA